MGRCLGRSDREREHHLLSSLLGIMRRGELTTFQGRLSAERIFLEFYVCAAGIFVVLPPDRILFPHFCGENCPEKSSKNTPAKSSKMYTAEIPDTFLQSARAKIWRLSRRRTIAISSTTMVQWWCWCGMSAQVRLWSMRRPAR